MREEQRQILEGALEANPNKTPNRFDRWIEIVKAREGDSNYAELVASNLRDLVGTYEECGVTEETIGRIEYIEDGKLTVMICRKRF